MLISLTLFFAELLYSTESIKMVEFNERLRKKKDQAEHILFEQAKFFLTTSGFSSTEHDDDTFVAKTNLAVSENVFR